MNRRYLLPLTALAISCSGPQKIQEFPFPQTLAGWQLKAQRDLPKSDLPGVMDPLSVQRIQQATYAGPGEAIVTIYHVSSSGVALDMAQRWYPEADQVVFYKDRFFVTVKYTAPERATVQRFLAQL